MQTVDDSTAILLLLLCVSVIDTSDRLTIDPQNDDQLDQTSSFRRRMALEDKPDEIMEERREIRLRLLDGILLLLDPVHDTTALTRWTFNMTKLHLLALVSPEEFMARSKFDINQILSSKAYEHLDFVEKARYLCVMLHLLWDCPWPQTL